jgi:hypothetical protein
MRKGVKHIKQMKDIHIECIYEDEIMCNIRVIILFNNG